MLEPAVACLLCTLLCDIVHLQKEIVKKKKKNARRDDVGNLVHLGYLSCSLSLMALLSLEFSVFVGDLSSEVDDYQLHQFFLKKYPSCKGGKVVSDQYGNSRYER